MKMQKMNPFIDLYKKLNLISSNGRDYPLRQTCSNRKACWKDANKRFPPRKNDWCTISQPWKGTKYDELGLVAIGENLNEYGGRDALIELTDEAQELIQDGYRRIRFHATYDQYPGSFLWHRLGCYSVVIGEYLGIISPKWGIDGYPAPEYVATAFDWIAFTEHVKCSPKRDMGRPTSTMWKHCGAHILREELKILKPKHVLVLGQSNNAWFLSEHVLDSRWKNEKKIGAVTLAKGDLHGKPVFVWVVPHPQSYGGAAKSILDDLKTAICKFKKT